MFLINLKGFILIINIILNLSLLNFNLNLFLLKLLLNLILLFKELLNKLKLLIKLKFLNY